jgi:protocatechuate 3,4-dioxygenase beta subunit
MKAALIMLAALPLLAAGAGHFGLRGRILDAHGARQIPDAIVTVSTPAGYISSVVTNQAGEYSFASLHAGEYDFRVTAHGYAIYEREMTVSANGGVRELDIRMLVPVNKQTVSVSELMNPAVTQSVSRESSATRGGY